MSKNGIISVSYTHLDVYKRQIYTLIEIVDYKGRDKFAKVIQGISVSPSCARQGCYINTTYQDDRGRYVLKEMLEGLKDNGTYFGYVQNNDNQDMLYARCV